MTDNIYDLPPEIEMETKRERDRRKQSAVTEAGTRNQGRSGLACGFVTVIFLLAVALAALGLDGYILYQIQEKQTDSLRKLEETDEKLQNLRSYVANNSDQLQQIEEKLTISTEEIVQNFMTDFQSANNKTLEKLKSLMMKLDFERNQSEAWTNDPAHDLTIKILLERSGWFQWGGSIVKFFSTLVNSSEAESNCGAIGGTLAFSKTEGCCDRNATSSFQNFTREAWISGQGDDHCNVIDAAGDINSAPCNETMPYLCEFGL